MAEASPFPADDELREFLRGRVQPLLAVDRGRVDLVRTDAATGRVVLRYADVCAGCPGLSITHSTVVAPLLRGRFPAVVTVDALIEGELERTKADG